MPGIERGGFLELRQGLGEMRRLVQGVSQVEPVIEIAGIECDGKLEVRDALSGILLDPPDHAEMVVRHRQPRVETDRPLEVRDGFPAPVQHRQQKSDLVLDVGGLGIESGGLLPGG